MTTDESAAARPLVYAHRGASGAFAEHTRAAYLQAIADGADGVECDVRLTRDRQVVLLHDSTLDRTSDGTGQVADRMLEELRRLDFSSWKGARIPEAYGAKSEQFLTLPELLDILRAAGRPIGLAIEFKHPSSFHLGLEDRALDVLRDRGWNPATSMLENIMVSFMSFSPDAVKHLLESVPAGAVCQLVDDVNVAEIREELRLGALTGGALANVMKAAQAEGERILAAGEAGMAGPGIGYVRAFPGTVERWIGSGRRIRVWTVDAEDDVERCRELGVHEITTNWPAQVLTQLMTDRQPLR
ncbi:glycerophosphodiester phosphodiesterase family protein [Arthrobacter sp. ES3-54]|jgi:glycerophosphoryl diester phosphodiesterase|uniref:glycerophosphodiester phosphodiesterase n=1 Tax=Arthrobacter sp. ES3-54 TaxID=1502991 RepID=UPI002405B8EA|nr:glycerophosphodiester phosphodiesterase family protein [Arthrobacter sp. ES3-54]MDF9750173.1 glycerophosphoryl diester phosphodiesterase [Arthrobacter sp. ES3-54]